MYNPHMEENPRLPQDRGALTGRTPMSIQKKLQPVQKSLQDKMKKPSGRFLKRRSL